MCRWHMLSADRAGRRDSDPRGRGLACPDKKTLGFCLRLFVRAGDGNRTHISSLEGWCSTTELHPHIQYSQNTLDYNTMILYLCQSHYSKNHYINTSDRQARSWSASIGVTGFEPATSWSQTRRSSQAEPHPVA